MKMKRATYRHVEAEIYSYNDTLKAIEELREDIILARFTFYCSSIKTMPARMISLTAFEIYILL